MASYRALRGLAVVMIGWAGARATYHLAFDDVSQVAKPAALAGAEGFTPVASGRVATAPELAVVEWRVMRGVPGLIAPNPAPRPLSATLSSPLAPAIAPALAAVPVQPRIEDAPPLRPVPAIEGVPRVARRSGWHASGWLFLRGGASVSALASSGQLGGSQTGARITAPAIAEPGGVEVAPTLRLSSALAPFAQQEGAVGLSLRKSFAGGSVALIAERRFSISGAGRNAFGAGLSGGWEGNWPDRRLTVRGYAQAGYVGLGARDGYADGALGFEREFARTDSVRIAGGAGAWGAAQPGLSRVDIGPAAAAMVRVGPANIRASIDWRFRVAGNALPGSGPVVTIGTDF